MRQHACDAGHKAVGVTKKCEDGEENEMRLAEAFSALEGRSISQTWYPSSLQALPLCKRATSMVSMGSDWDGTVSHCVHRS